MRIESPCICGNTGKYSEESVIHTPLGREIKVNHVPHFKCPNCGSIWYNAKTCVSEVVVYAYKHELTEIDYAEWIKNKNAHHNENRKEATATCTQLTQNPTQPENY